jgi:hypothetical protein
MANMTRTRRPADAMRWIWRGSALAVIAIGWAFIAAQNNFHVTPPVVFVGLGYFAGVAAIYSLFRTGAAVVAADPEDDGQATWGRPMGARGELEREKRTLLKAIKEAEFDHQMGKLSKRDADEMIATYRARAIEVIKEIDRLERAASGTGTVRDRIQREVRARLEVEIKPSKKAAAEAERKKKAKAEGKSESKSDPKAEDKADVKVEEKAERESAANADESAPKSDESAAKADESAAKTDESAAKTDESAAKTDETVESSADAKPEGKSGAKSKGKGDAKSKGKAGAKKESKSDAKADSKADDDDTADVKEATP